MFKKLSRLSSCNLPLISLLLFLFFPSKGFATLSAKAFSKDQSSSTATKPSIFIQNTGTDTLKDFYWYYYFTVEGDKAPVLQQDYVRYCTFRIDSLGNSNYRLRYYVAKSSAVVPPGAYFPDNTSGEQIELHYSGWTAWDVANDYSYANNGSFIENKKIAIHLVANDSLIYGTPPSYAAKPAAKFSASQTSGYDSLTVHFIDSSTGGISSRLWIFGDGATDTARNPVHTYRTIGSFPVKLVLSGIGGKDSLSIPNYITVAVGKPDANFSALPRSGIDTLTVRFTDSSSGNITSRLWSFGDSATDTAKNPIHKYLSRNTFTVQLIVTGPGGADTLIRPNFISVTPPRPKAAFGASKTSGIDSLTVFFFDSSAGDIGSRLWSFGDNSTDTAKNPVHLFKTTGSFYVKLTVSGPGGVDSAVKTNFIVVSPPQPRAAFSVLNGTGNDSLTARFIDSSTGIISSRIWRFGDNQTDTAKNPVHFYGGVGKYSVSLVVFGSGGKDSLFKAGFITVNSSIPKAGFSASPLSGPDSVITQFHDSSTGIITARLWDFGDGATSTEKDPLHRFTAVDTYTVKLTVSGPKGKDTMEIKDLIKVTPTMARANFSVSPDSGAKPLSVKFTDRSTGTVGQRLWLFGDDSTSSGNNPVHVYASEGVFTITLIVSGPGGSDTAIQKNLITVVDTNAPGNRLRISGRYLGGDSVEITLDSIAAIDTSKTPLVGIWYGFSDSANFQDALQTRWLNAGTVKREGTGGAFAIVVKNSLFSGTVRSVTIAVALKAVNERLSPPRNSAVKTGTSGMLNPLRLGGRSESFSSITLAWTGAAGIDSVRIWKGLSPIPLSQLEPGAGFDRLTVAKGDTTVTVPGLFPKTTYFFGAQAYGAGAWTFLTSQSCASVTTLEDPDPMRIVNSCRLEKLLFDAATNSITVRWTMDSTQNRDYATVAYSIGISCTFGGYPSDTSVAKQITPFRSLSDSAIVNISDEILFDTMCYVALWMKKNTGVWSSPTPASRDTVRMPPLSWQKISYFSPNDPADTVYAFNRRVRLCNDVVIPTTADTLKHWSPADSLLKGFMPVSIGFSFSSRIPSPAFFVGLRCDGIPSNRSIGDVRIFRFNGDLWSVESSVGTDRAAGYVWVKTRDIGAPFIAMIDTMKPIYQIVSHPAEAIHALQPVADTFIVADNISNLRCSFKFAKGGNAFDENRRIDTVLSAYRDTLVLSTPGEFASEDNGLRAYLILDDGINRDTAVVSRSVIRDQLSDVIATGSQKWLPLRVTAYPDSPNVKTGLKAFSTKSGWKYDPNAFRLFRWHAYGGNSGKSDKWVEYADSVDGIFKFVPGNLLWLKSRKDTVLEFGRAVTPSLLEDYQILLPAKNWTDIALPFKFDILVGDILDATGARDSSADSLQFYGWKYSTAGKYVTDPLFVAGLSGAYPTLGNRASVLLSENRVGYSIYNPLDRPVTLYIPPLPASLSSVASSLEKKSAPVTSGRWAVKISGRTNDDEPLSPVVCGFVPGKNGVSFFPAPPSLSGISMRVCDDKSNLFGHEIQSGSFAAEGGATFILAFGNSGDRPKTIACELENAGELPKGATAVVYDAETGILEPVAQALRGVPVPPNGRVFRHLIVGDKAYLAKMQRSLKTWSLDLIGAYPNPFGKMVRIRYSLPQKGVDRVTISILSLLGRVEYQQTAPCLHKSGVQEMLWNGRNAGNQKIASGLYVVKMTAFDDKSGVVGTFKRRITYLP